VRRQSSAASLSASVPLLTSSTNLCNATQIESCLSLNHKRRRYRETRGNGTHLLVEVEEEAVVGKSGGRVGPEEREGRVDVSQLERAARAADEEARPVG